jgi:cyanate permease
MWILVLSWGFAQFAMAGSVLHMVPFFQDLGFPLVLAAGALSLRSSIALAGSLGWGFALERLPLKPAASCQFLLTGLGLAMWLLPPSEASLLAGIIFFGLGASGSQVVAEVIWASYYGRLSLGTARGVAYPISTMFAAVGPLAVGLLYDLSGSYQSSFSIMIAGCVASAILIQLAQRPVHRRAATPPLAQLDR